MKTYNKPEFYVEEFAANCAVAGCNRMPIGSTIEIGKQKVTCVRQGSTEYLFNSGSCDYMPTAYGYYNATGKNTNNTTTEYDFFETADAAYSALSAKDTNGNYTALLSGPNKSNPEHTPGHDKNYCGYMEYEDPNEGQSYDFSIWDGFYALWTDDKKEKQCFGIITPAVMAILGFSF